MNPLNLFNFLISQILATLLKLHFFKKFFECLFLFIFFRHKGPRGQLQGVIISCCIISRIIGSIIYILGTRILAKLL